MARRHHDILLSLLKSECREQATHLGHLWLRGTARARTHKIISFLNSTVSDKEIYIYLLSTFLRATYVPLSVSLPLFPLVSLTPLDAVTPTLVPTLPPFKDR